jgi:hypothetical protein
MVRAVGGIAFRQRLPLFRIVLWRADLIVGWMVWAGHRATDVSTGVKIFEQSLAMTCVQESSGHRPQDC